MGHVRIETTEAKLQDLIKLVRECGGRMINIDEDEYNVEAYFHPNQVQPLIGFAKKYTCRIIIDFT